MTPAAAFQIEKALDRIERAQVELNAACAELSPLVGLIPEWKRVGALADRVKVQWHRLENIRRKRKPGVRLDSETAS